MRILADVTKGMALVFDTPGDLDIHIEHLEELRRFKHVEDPNYPAVYYMYPLKGTSPADQERFSGLAKTREP